uniref:Uncharacterized protein n=1 Tax=Micrurus lemniscatus lemniscatus TaxID=129467 RepID=A0A2D4HDC0_MICLE
MLLNGAYLTALVETSSVWVPWNKLRTSASLCQPPCICSAHRSLAKWELKFPESGFDSPSPLFNSKGSSTHPSPAQPQNMGRVLQRTLQKQVPVSFPTLQCLLR